MSAPYAWIITHDATGTPIGEPTDVGRAGPRNATPTLIDLASKAGAEFQLYDGDDELYYRGRITGKYDGFEPLDDFGAGNAGCTAIKYRDPGTGKWGDYL